VKTSPPGTVDELSGDDARPHPGEAGGHPADDPRGRARDDREDRLRDPDLRPPREPGSFAGYENHIGFYPGASGVRHFADELEAYETSKGTIRFPLTEPVPLDLVRRIAEFRVRENRAR
jgi:hypothetical protein